MTRVSPPQVAFSSGEISPLLHRRFDFQRYQSGMRTCRGFLPLRQGGFTRAPGTIDWGATRLNRPARLINFEFAANDAVTLEFTDLCMRVWRYGAPVMVAGTPYELVTPFPASSLDRLQWVQSADVIYITDGLRPIQRLARYALDNWTIGAAVFDNGPFRVPNLDKTKIVSASGTTGAVTLHCNSGLFDASYIGAILRLEAVDTDVPTWTGNTAVAAGQKMRYAGRTYVLTVGTNTGVNPPTHIEGEQRVSLSPDVRWRFVDDGWGIVRITGGSPAVSPATAVTAQVLKTLPQGIVTTGTYRFAEGAWSDKYGYPAALELYEQRLVAAATASEPRTLWFSTAGALNDFTSGTDADSAFAYTIAGGSTINRILWLKRGKTGLHIGALGEEYSTRTTDRGVAIGPTTTVFGLDGTLGSADSIRPIAPDGRPIFVARDGARIFEITYSFQEDANIPNELTLIAEHFGRDGFAEIAWQSAPMRLCWFRRGNGELAALVYDPAQEVMGWSQQSLAGGLVESMAVTPDATGRRDILAMVVRRTVLGQTVRRIEEMAVPYGVQSEALPISEAVHLYGSAVLHPVPAAASFTLPHLAGETVMAWTDKGQFGPLAADTAGVVTLPVPVGSAVIGRFDATHFAETLDLLGAAPDGSTMGRARRLSPKVKIGVHRTADGEVMTVERELVQPERVSGPQALVRRAVAADLSSAWSGVAQVDLTSGYAGEISLRFRPGGGAPMTITAVVPPVSEAGL